MKELKYKFISLFRSKSFKRIMAVALLITSILIVLIMFMRVMLASPDADGA